MYVEAADLVAAAWYAYLNASRYATVLAWIRRFPAAFVDGDVRLRVAQAWAQSLSGPPGRRRLASLGSRRPAPGWVQLGRGEPRRHAGVFPWERVSGSGPPPSGPSEPTLALGVSLTARGRPAEALPVLEHAIAVARLFHG